MKIDIAKKMFISIVNHKIQEQNILNYITNFQLTVNGLVLKKSLLYDNLQVSSAKDRLKYL